MKDFRYFQHTDMSIAVIDTSAADRVKHYENDPQYIEVVVRTQEEIQVQELTEAVFSAVQHSPLVEDFDLNESAAVARTLYARGVRIPRRPGR